MTAREVHDRIKSQANELREMELQRQRTSERVREALDREQASQTVPHKAKKHVTLPPEDGQGRLTADATRPKRGSRGGAATDDATSPRTRKLIVVLTVVFLVGAIASIGLAITTPSGAYVLAQDAFCMLTRGYFTPDYAQLTEAFNALDATQFPPPVHSAEHNRSLFWGTYRPQLLAGVKSREEQPLLFGIGWYDLEGRYGVRHTAEETNEVHFLWEAHDGRTYGREIIQDHANNLDVSVRFLKSPDGLGWTLRVDGVRRTRSSSNRRPLEFFLYFATETTAPANDAQAPLLAVDSDAKEFSTVANPKLTAGAFSVSSGLTIKGKLSSGRHFHAHVNDAAGPWLMDAHWEAFGWPSKPDQWQMDFRRGGERLQAHRQYQRHAKQHGSIVLKKRITEGFRFDVKLTEQMTIEPHDAFPSACTVSRLFSDREAHFHRRFERTFGVRAAAEALQQTAAGMPSVSTLVRMAETAVSNMVGGIGYWHGDYYVKTSKGGHTTHGPATLFSGVPSRAKFPRGFLWDEGFHQLLVAKWDAPLSKDIILHWIDGNVVDRTTGWIPREQILGAEPRTRVPAEFVAQTRSHTNPPAMLLQVENFALQARQGLSNDDSFLNRALPAVRRWLSYLLKSQCGGSPDCSKTPLTAPNASYLFRWRSRNKYHLLASGLDDYPRPHCAPDWKELHVDLFSWAAMMSKTVERIESSLGLKETSAGTSQDTLPSYQGCVDRDECEPTVATPEPWTEALESLHFDASRKQYSDVTGCSTDPSSPKYFSPHFGYVNLFPFMTMIIESPERALTVMRQARSELSGGYGLQSLSNASRRQLKDHDDYWTGPIWINLNYLMLRALKVKYIAMLGDEARDFYVELRHDLVRNIGREFARTGKLWENYDLRSGTGRGTAPFTGWTALVVAILAEQY